jgi:putative membrane protein
MTGHMLGHILAMNVAAPLIVLLVRSILRPGTVSRGGFVASAAAAQLLLLWGWHSPAAVDLAASSTGVAFLMTSSLTVAALLISG